MSAKAKNMTEGNPLGLIFSFALPLMAGNVFQQLYTVVDTMVVGQVLGVTALAALGAAEWINWMMLGMIQGFTQGFSIRMAQQFGAGKKRELDLTVAASGVLAAILAVFLVVFGEALLPMILQIMRTPGDVYSGTMLYLRIMFAGIPIVMAYNLFASILRAVGDGRSPLYAMVVACMVNIGLDIVFVAYWGLGIAGAAAATLIAQACSALFCVLSLRKMRQFDLRKTDFKMDLPLYGKLMGLGLPMAFQNGIISVGGMIVQTVVNGFGVLFLAGFTATNKLYGVLEVAATSYGYAMVTYTGQNLGAGRIDRIRKGMRSALLAAIVTSAVISACMLLFGRQILSLFISGSPEDTNAALNIGYHYLSIMSWLLVVLYFLHIYRSTLQGLGDTVLPMVSGIAEFIMRTGAAALLPRMAGEEGIFYAEISAWLGADVILISAYYIRMYQIRKRSLEMPSFEPDTGDTVKA